MTANHTDTHEYIGMNIAYLKKEKAVEFGMKLYFEEAIVYFPRILIL